MAYLLTTRKPSWILCAATAAAEDFGGALDAIVGHRIAGYELLSLVRPSL